MNRNDYLELCSEIICFLEGYTSSQDSRKKKADDDKELAIKVRELLVNVKPYFKSKKISKEENA